MSELHQDLEGGQDNVQQKNSFWWQVILSTDVHNVEVVKKWFAYQSRNNSCVTQAFLFHFQQTGQQNGKITFKIKDQLNFVLTGWSYWCHYQQWKYELRPHSWGFKHFFREILFFQREQTSDQCYCQLAQIQIHKNQAGL